MNVAVAVEIVAGIYKDDLPSSILRSCVHRRFAELDIKQLRDEVACIQLVQDRGYWRVLMKGIMNIVQGRDQWLVLVKGIMIVVQGRYHWLVLVKGIMNVVQDKKQCRVLLKKTKNFLSVEPVAWL